MTTFALDRDSVRQYDVDGRLRVETVILTREEVAEYLGREVPGWQELGLDGDRIYKLYRPGDEIEKAAPTLRGLPLLSEHVPVNADDHRPDLVIGSVGTDVEWDGTYLKGSLLFWSADAIRDVESGAKREVSLGYRYTPSVEAGQFNGVAYSLVMRDLVFNHCAAVAAARVKDAVIGDSALTTPTEKQPMKQPPTARALMARGALLRVADGNLLAADAKPDFAKLAAGVPAKGKAAPGLLDAIKPHLAQDADIDEVRAILDLVDAVEEGEMDSTVAEDDASPDAFLKGKLSEEDYAKYKELCAPAAQDEDKDGDKPKDDEKKDDDMKNEPKGVTAQAMDAAIKSAVKAAEERATSAAIKLANDIDAARRDVRPAVGDLHLAADSADGVYAAALKTLGVSTEGMEPSAYRHVFAAHASAKTTRTVIAQDAAPSSDFDKAFGSALSVKTV